VATTSTQGTATVATATTAETYCQEACYRNKLMNKPDRQATTITVTNNAQCDSIGQLLHCSI